MIKSQKSYCLKIILVLNSIFYAELLHAQNITVSGIIKEAGTQENIPYVNIRADSIRVGVAANAFGFYSVKLPAGRAIELRYSAIGYQTFVKK